MNVSDKRIVIEMINYVLSPTINRKATTTLSVLAFNSTVNAEPPTSTASQEVGYICYPVGSGFQVDDLYDNLPS